MKKAEFYITSGSDVQIDQDSCTPADCFLNRIVRQSAVKSEPGACLQFWDTALRVDFYHIQSFTGLFDPRMIRGIADLQYCTDLRNFTYAVEHECIVFLQAPRRGELKVRDLFFGINGSPFGRSSGPGSPNFS